MIDEPLKERTGIRVAGDMVAKCQNTHPHDVDGCVMARLAGLEYLHDIERHLNLANDNPIKACIEDLIDIVNIMETAAPNKLS